MTIGRFEIKCEYLLRNDTFLPFPVIGVCEWDSWEFNTGIAWLAWAITFTWDRRNK